MIEYHTDNCEMSGFMSEFIIGLGISVKICKLYEELIYLTFSSSDMTREYFDNVDKLKKLIEDETSTYDELSSDSITKYFERICEEDISEFDAVKSRYYSKLRERKELFDNGDMHGYSFTLGTAIMGKILLETLVNVERRLLIAQNENDDKESIYNLYSFHKTYKYSLIASNEFAEKIATDFNFQLSTIPNIDFDKIKTNFGAGKYFDVYLNDWLIKLAKNIIDELINKNTDNIEVNEVYNSLLVISQLEVIISYLNINDLYKLNSYCQEKNVSETKNGKYIRRILINKLKKS